MADSSVLLEVILEGKNIKVVQKQVDKATASTNKLSGAQEKLNKGRSSYNKGEKGVAQATANSTKAFSKMRSEIGGGSSGLVAAYATLAANLFAATAAFNALRGASKVEELSRSLDVIGIKSGRNLNILAESLREVTNAAISTEQALRTAAIATSAGFSDAQLLNLTKVAKGASIALGRDLGDSLDRLVRGTAKLEPEILDELGIFVRLDDATREYARTLGKTSEELTDFERRQAFLNSAIQKGEKRFGELAETLDTNPYDKLGAAFRDLAKNLVTAINGSITPAIGFLSNNLSALAGVSLVAGSGVAKNVVSSFVQGAEGAADFAEKLSGQRKELLENLETTERLPEVYKDVSSKIKDGTASLEDYKTGFKSLEKSTKIHQQQLDAMKDKTKKFSFTVEEKRQRLRNVQDTLKNLRTQLIVSTAAQANFTKAQALGAIQSGNFITGIKLAVQSVKEYAIGLRAAAAGAGAATAANIGLKISFFALGVAVQTAFAAVLSAISIIGILIALGPQLKDWVENTFFPEVIVKRRRDEIVKSLDIIKKTSKDFSKDFFNSQITAAGAAKKASGLIQESISAVEKAAVLDAEAQKKRAEEIIALEAKKLEFKEAATERGINAEDKDAKGFNARRFREISAEIKALQEINNQGIVANSNAIEVANKAVDNFYSVLQSRDQVGLLPESSIHQIDEAIKLLETGGEDALQNFIETLKGIKEPFDKVTAGFESLNGKINDFKDAQTTLLKRTATPYDDILEKAKGIQTEIGGITENVGKLSEVTGETVIAKDVLDKIKEAGFESQEQLDTYISTLEEGIKNYIKFPGLIKQQETALKRLNKFAKEDVNILEQALDQQVLVNSSKLEALLNEEKLIKANQKSGQEGKAQAARLLEIEGEKAILAEENVKTLDDAQEIAVARVEQEKRLFDLSKKVTQQVVARTKAQMEIKTIAREIERLESGAGEFSAEAKLGIFMNEKKARQELLAIEYSQKVQGINLEYDLLEAKYELLKAQAKANNVELTNTQTIENLMKQGRTASLANAVTQFDLSLKRLDLEEAQLNRSVKDARTAFSAGLQGSGGPASLIDTIRTAQANRETTIDNLPAVGTVRADGTTVTQEDNDSAKARAKIQEAQAVMAPFIAQLEKLGPEGMLVSAIAQSSLVIADSFQTIGEKGLATAEGLAAVGAVMSSIASIANAASDAKIAGIDKEIEAEKKRDGKSKESLAKIKALEARKEKEKRKQFEMNKKMMMAQTVINTAAAVMATMKDTGFFGSPLAMLVAALGAAQLAIIAGTSYQGGGSSGGGTNMPKEISVGERSNKVDVAQQATGSELAGLRGGNTTQIGGMPTSAFMGAKYRAEGGPTAGYVVGEQGPELFVPEMPGRIVPNDEMKQAQPLNVNFNVQAIDASSFNDALIAQRGNIIGMIREAANTYGETFLEGVNDSAISAGRGKI